MLEYILKTSVCWAAFYALYFVFLRKETFFKTNRIYLLLTLCLGAIIPLLENILPEAPTETITLYLAPINLDLISDSFVVTPDEQEPAFSFLTWPCVLLAIYMIGLIISLSRFIYGLNKIYRLHSTAEVQSLKSYFMVHTREPHLPFSFFNMMFINKDYKASQEDTAKIVLHEEAHIQAGHSFDIILLELFAIIFWCSPLIYLYRKSIKAVHEYMADEKVLQTTSTYSYGHLLLSHSQAAMQVAMANHFIHSLLKQRIIMMTRNKSNRKNLIKYILAIPIILILLLLFKENTSTSANAQTSSYLSRSEILENQSISEANIPTVFSGQNTSNDGQFFDPIYTHGDVDQMPRFLGCEDRWCSASKFVEFVSQNFKYPEEARKAGIQGDVIISALIDKTGKLKDAKVIKSVGSGCDEEALRIIHLMPQFIPGMNNGKKVEVLLNFPFDFNFQEDDNLTKAVLVSEEDTAKIYKVVEEMPRFPGCEDLPMEERKPCSQQKLLEFIYSNIKYPAEARTSTIEGVVVIRFIVLKNGKLGKIEAIRKIGGGCDEEALKVVGMMPDWIPGKQNGEVVEVQYNLPIKYKLQEEEKVDQPAKINNDGESKSKFLYENFNEENPPNNAIEQMPRFPGCEDEIDKEACSREKLNEFIFKQIKYTNSAKLKGIEGMTVIRFIVDKTGKITNPEIVKEIGGGCGIESLRIVKSMPDWIPGEVNGEAVAVEFNLPIKYALPKSGIEHAIEIDKTMDETSAKISLEKMAEGGKITPRFPGCENITGDKNQCANQKMYSYIYKNINYPNGIQKDKIKGEIRVRFMVTENGKIINPEISKGLNEELDKEILRVVGSMPKWIPGVAKDKNLSITISVPLSFNKGTSSLDTSQKAFIDGKIHPTVKDKLRSAYSDSYESDVSHNKGFTREQQEDYILTFKAIEMTMKEYDKNAKLRVGTGEGENKTSEEWLRHMEKALKELQDFNANKNGNTEEFKNLFDRVHQNKIRISYGQN